jgi:hypothetical protein
MKHKGDSKATPPKGQPSPKPQSPGAPATPGTSTHKQ